jgi:hypothetical protein
MVSATDYSEWRRKGATLSNVTARKELGLTDAEIFEAIREGRLQWREGSAHGNPYLRLLRREVEALVRRQHGDAYVKDRKARSELAHIDRELRRLRSQISDLEDRRAKLSRIAPLENPRRSRKG